MQNSKKNVFKIEFSSLLGQGLKLKKKNRLIVFIKKHKLISITLAIFIICFSLNLIMIYNFMKIIESI